MLSSVPLVAIGQMSSTNRFRAGVVTAVRCSIIPGTSMAVLFLTTIAGESGTLDEDASDMITIDLDAPASEMMKSLGESSSSVLRAMFGGN